MAKSKEPKVSLKRDWWPTLRELCSTVWPEFRRPFPVQSVYDKTLIAQRTFNDAKRNSCFTERTFLRLATSLNMEWTVLYQKIGRSDQMHEELNELDRADQDSLLREFVPDGKEKPTTSSKKIDAESRTGEQQSSRDGGPDQRRWEAIQSNEFTNLRFTLLLKSGVTVHWLKKALENARIISGKKKSFILAEVFHFSARANSSNSESRKPTANYSFWEFYDHGSTCWVLRKAPAFELPQLVSGIEIEVPWDLMQFSNLKKLSDFANLAEFGYSLPPELFKAGIEECELYVSGQYFSFTISLQEHSCIEIFEEMSGAFKPSLLLDRVSFCNALQGPQCLELCYSQMSSTYQRKSSQGMPSIAQCGPNDKSICFYPAVPSNFKHSVEARDYAFTISTPDEMAESDRLSELSYMHEQGNLDEKQLCELAYRYREKGQVPRAIAVLVAGIEPFPNSVLASCILAQCYNDVGRFTEAIQVLLEAEKIEELDFTLTANLHNILGLSYAEIEQQSLASQHFKRAASLDDSHYGHFYNLGNSLAIESKRGDAIEAFRSSLALRDDFSASWLSLAVLLSASGKRKEANAAFERAKELAPNEWAISREYVKHLQRHDDFKAAIKVLSDFPNCDENAECLDLLGHSCTAVEEWAGAEKAFSAALALDPSNSGNIQNLIVCLVNQNELFAAKQIVERWIEAEPRNQNAKSTLKEILLELRSQGLN
jgi:tetratricopeptide (TPR) repeat protein